MSSQRATAIRQADRSTVRERVWLWGHDAGSHNDEWGLPAPSRITPAEAAFYLGIPNLIMVRYKGRPPLPLDQFAIPLRAFRQIVWSAVGAHGQTDEVERSHILKLATRHPNVTGIMLDDFFAESPGSGGEATALSLNELRELRGHLASDGRRLNLWAVLYEHQMNAKLAPFLELLDVVSLWSWEVEKLLDIRARLGQLEALDLSCKKVIGCYMWDYGGKRPLRPRTRSRGMDTGMDSEDRGSISLECIEPRSNKSGPP